MADKFFSCVVGEQMTKEVTVADSTTSEAIELRVTTGTDVLVTLKAIDAIARKIMESQKQAIA